MRSSGLESRTLVDSGEFGDGGEAETGCGVEVADDYIRNFLLRNNMHATLCCFETEWHQRLGEIHPIPVQDVYEHNRLLEETIEELKTSLEAMKLRATNVEMEVSNLRKEREEQKIHKKRILTEKFALLKDKSRLRSQCDEQERSLKDGVKKYEQQLKETSLIALQRDRLQQKLMTVQKEQQPVDDEIKAHRSPQTTERASSSAMTAFCKRNRNQCLHRSASKQPLVLSKLDSCKTLNVECTLHPTKPLVVSASDDLTWKLWSLEDGQTVMTGEGHSDWISGIDFDTQGMGIVTGSADATVKIWNLKKKKCVQTLHENQAVWSVKYHRVANVLATGSLDHVARMWDVQAEKRLVVFRGHTDSVNEVAWQSYRPVLCTASSDKTLCLWDARDGRRAATLFGHSSACKYCSFISDGHILVSCDLDGGARTWDVRVMRQIASMSSPSPNISANKCAIDHSGRVAAVVYNDGYLRSYDLFTGALQEQILAHEESSALSVLCDTSNGSLFSSGADGTVKYWTSESSRSTVPFTDLEPPAIHNLWEIADDD